jgi:pimeloyl-ACP methyl ester carboxylesterase
MAMVGLELAACTLQFSALAPCERWLRPRGAASRGADPPVLFVHGFICNGAYWWPMLRELHRHGWRSLHTLNLEPVFAGIETYVPDLAERVEAVLERTGADRLIIVAHSMGGLVARAYVAAEPGSSRVRKLITLGSPHRGTLLAYAALSENAREMRPGSLFLRDLAARESAGIAVPTTSVWSVDDNIVVPRASARLEHARNIEVAGVMHVSMSLAPEIQALVLAELAAECPQR